MRVTTGLLASAMMMASLAVTSTPGVVLAAGPEGRVEPVFTVEQAAAGKSAFAKNCAMCHMPDLSGDNDVPQLAGANFMNTWRRRTTKDLFEYMSTAMPPGGGLLPADTYAAIVAYVLQSNGAVPGGGALTTSTIVSIGSVVDSAGAESGK